ncbi:McrB family protein [Natranaerofaba carboxydovora]|uniref:McrB family protein n=1 Tax=Natranaerofaba carboxydovora TaxID=2742683 RepID=UPI001F130059|nr:AAA family ATPase [Natranaerofaba carboxydovora]UMZ73725.1 5-methylcytosine-specific restriction enzyme B [Natranaerofaba carboxydovora]
MEAKANNTVGPPGTGKTYYALKFAREIIAQNNFEKSYHELTKSERQYLDLEQASENYLYFCTFHPAFGYEEFIEGYRPKPGEKGSPEFVLQEGIFKKMCQKAMANLDKTFVLIIDEINRGNIPRIFGELITLLEKDKRYRDEDNKGVGVVLPMSSEPFYVPDNVLVIGTMNSADRSIALLDVALRRRFGFFELMPTSELLEGEEVEGINLGSFLEEINSRIAKEVGRNFQIGHSYFMERERPIKYIEEFSNCFKDKILPLLQEYCYDDYSRLSRILGSSFVDVESQSFKQEIFLPKNKERLIDALKSFTEVDQVDKD